MYKDAKPILIANRNNKLECLAFVEINFAPKEGTVITDQSMETVYVIKHNDESIYVRLVDFSVIRFRQISTSDTIAATGQDAFEWALEWLKKYPHTNNETRMSIYAYRKIS